MTFDHNRPPGFFDVRMRGFHKRMEVADVVALIDRSIRPLPSERVDVLGAAGRVLTDGVVAPRSTPPFDRAAMDGYALRADDSFGAAPYNPLTLRIVGEALPGRPFSGIVAAGQAVRIMTGAPIPNGADAVLPAEMADESSGAVRVVESIPPGRHIGRVGEDVAAGNQVLPAGRRLRPQDIGLLASVGIRSVSVVRRPRVSTIVTGDELVPPGTEPGPYQIVDTNSVVLRALVERDGGVALSALYLADRSELIREALLQCEADVILVSGGSSVGREDHAPRLVAELGTLPVHGIALRPASPTGLGFIDGRSVFLLPGNPVS
jgi:molybdopterin molybdotransferase